MINRRANAVWKGTGKEGTGLISTQSNVLENTQYSFNTRFADGIGTNPEELIAAAHAGCFAMQLSFLLNEAGFTADELSVSAVITLDPSQGAITKSALVLKGKVPGITAEKFDEIAHAAKEKCPVSKVLNAEKTLEVELLA
ncbi:OsmC family protein [Dyadobacter frigoris]|uniref:OsmC family protein n=1 Tax=Dyadobacter frigoris TaxID=2576211 RepID=A0A4U6D3C5_9BACT|nr:OsmC family protein [Dyadobacter frigoris]TKT90855.1 OsmC family protein [Dyadobacter frigoris]